MSAKPSALSGGAEELPGLPTGPDFLQRVQAFCAGVIGWRRAGLAALLGALASLALPPIGLLPLLYVSFPMLVWMLQGAQSRRRAFWLGWCFSFGHLAASLYWVSHALLVFSDALWWLVPIAALALPAGLALFGGLSLLAAWHARTPFGRAMGVALAWALGEYLRGTLFTGFPWNLTGHAWMVSDALTQSAAALGLYGMGLLALVSCCLPAVIPGFAWRRRLQILVAALAIPLIAWGAGQKRLEMAPPVQAVDGGSGPGLRLVQAGIPQREKWNRQYLRRNFDLHLTLSATTRPDWVKTVIWPETAAAFFLEEATQARQAIAAMMPEDGLMITGAPRRDRDPLRLYNGMVVLDDAGGIVENYNKAHLVPFGEYLPLKSVLGAIGLDKLTHGATDYSPGAGPRTLSLPGLPPVSPLICYEVIFPGAAVNPLQPAGWLLNLTNDAWYGHTLGPYQHLALTRLRGVEEGLPMVRAGNTGISAVFDGYGREIARLGLDERGIIDFRLPPAVETRTAFAQYGNMLPLGLWLLLALGVILLDRRRPAASS